MHRPTLVSVSNGESVMFQETLARGRMEAHWAARGLGTPSLAFAPLPPDDPWVDYGPQAAGLGRGKKQETAPTPC